jgi:UDP-4-amino-4,6-dideoxy-N-acetyl-beta-L-altrosamine N-acetyltransferase
MGILSSSYIEYFYSFKDICILEDIEKKMVWEWRNHISIRQMMYNKNLINFDNHLKFIESLKKSNTKKYWLVKRRNLNVGALYLANIQKNRGELGFYLAPEFHKILSVEFYYYSLNYLFESFGVTKLYGFTLVQNTSANSLNDLFGFSKHLVDKEINGVIEKYYFRELASDIWLNKIKIDKKIDRLLRWTQNKL